MKYKLKKALPYLIALVVVTILMLIIYYFKGIIPFGNKNIIEADLGQSYVSFYYYLRDIIFGNHSFLWSFNFEGGSIIQWGIATDALFSPLNLILAFVKPNSLLNFIPIYLITRIALMSLTFSIFIRHAFKKTNWFYTIVFSLLFAFSGFVFLSYHNIIWLDSLIYLPLLAMATLHLFNKQKVIPFIIILALEFITSYYISYMLCLAIVTCGSIFIYYFVPKEHKKEVMLKGILGVITSVLIALPFFLPSILQTPNTLRAQLYSAPNTTNEYLTKINFYLCSGLLLIIPIISLFHDVKTNNKKNLKYWLLTIIPLLLGIIIEKINLIWHGGSYVMFPYRYGFIPLFFILCCGISYINKNEKNEKFTWHGIELIKILVFILMMILVISVYKANISTILAYDLTTGLFSKTVFLAIFKIFLSFTICYLIIIKYKSTWLKYLMIFLLVSTEIVINGIMYFGREQSVITNYDYKTDLLSNAESYRSSFNINDDNKLNRYRDTTATMNENYGFALNVATIGGWTQYVSYNQYIMHRAWGYSTRYTRLQDLGGTLFSDAFYHVKYLFSTEDLSSNIYTKIKTYNGITLYEKKTMSLGIIHNNYNMTLDTSNTFSFQNEIYQKLYDKSDNIIEVIEPNFEQKDTELYYTTINLSNQSNLYLSLLRQGSYINEITINGKVITIPYIGNSTNTLYPTGSNQGIVDLGSYKGKVTIGIYSSYSDITDKIIIGYIDETKYNNLLTSNQNDMKYTLSKNTMNITVTANNNNQYLLLPIMYFDGIEAYVNNQKVVISSYLDDYINIPLSKGTNNIVIKFYPSNYKLYVVVSLLTVFLLIMITFLNKKYHYDQNKKILNLGKTLFIIFSIITFIYVYLYSLVK